MSGRLSGIDVKVGVSGACGHLRRAVVLELLQRSGEQEVVAISHTPGTIPRVAHGRSEDDNRPDSHAEVYVGLGRVLLITTHNPEPGRRGTQIVCAVDAVVSTGVKHSIF